MYFTMAAAQYSPKQRRISRSVSGPLDGIWVCCAVFMNDIVRCDTVVCEFFNYGWTTSGLATPAVWRSRAVPHNNRSTSVTLFLRWWDAKIVIEIWITAQLYLAPGRRRLTQSPSLPACHLIPWSFKSCFQIHTVKFDRIFAFACFANIFQWFPIEQLTESLNTWP